MATEAFLWKDSYKMEDLLEIIRLLRAPDGCPWDKVQTHASIRSCMVEEAYEVVDAIDRQDAHMLQEELGDVLMQVVFHAGIEQDAGRFDFDSVCDGICKKMIFRHPHVFAHAEGVDSSEQVLVQWEALKEKEKALYTARQDLEAIPNCLPALIQAQKQHKRAMRHGLVAQTREYTGQQLTENLQALLQAGDEPRQEKEKRLGELLHGLCGLANAWDIGAEQVLADENKRFLQRVTEPEK